MNRKSSEGTTETNIRKEVKLEENLRIIKNTKILQKNFLNVADTGKYKLYKNLFLLNWAFKKYLIKKLLFYYIFNYQLIYQSYYSISVVTNIYIYIG